MRADCGCVVDGDEILHGYDSRCAASPPEPTGEDHCAAGGHSYYGDDGDGSEGTMGRCWCGAQLYPPGGPGS